MKKLVALYKAYRGGEWFRASLESVRPFTVGAVVMSSHTPWVAEGAMGPNCSAPLGEFREAHADYPVVVVGGTWDNQEDQYQDGLTAIRQRFGNDVGVLIVDTDEVWDEGELKCLRERVAENSTIQTFRTGIRTYLRSPAYQVWPEENTAITVALQSPAARKIKGRFHPTGEPSVTYKNLFYHHYCYVRQDEGELGWKLRSTGSQDDDPLQADWMDTIYAGLPQYRNLHPCRKIATMWGRIKTLTPDAIPAGVRSQPWVKQLMRDEECRWHGVLRKLPPCGTVGPVPSMPVPRMQEDDVPCYVNDLLKYWPDDGIFDVLKVTCLEGLYLCYWASLVDGPILEIGAGFGGSSACFALASVEGAGGGPIEIVDPFTRYEEDTHAGLHRAACEGDSTKFWETCDRYGYRDRIVHHNCGSDDPQLSLGDDYSLIFDDGNHSYRYVAQNFQNCWSRLRPGGIYVIHDYTTRFPGVIKAVDEFEAEMGHEIVGGKFRSPGLTCLAYARKK